MSGQLTVSGLLGRLLELQEAREQRQRLRAGGGHDLVLTVRINELDIWASELPATGVRRLLGDWEALTQERDQLALELQQLKAEVGAPAWTTIPLDLAREVLTVGRAQWGETVAQDAEAHGAMMAQSVRLTAEHFQQGDEAQTMQGVFVEGTAFVIAYTGTSPYSGTTAQGITAAWNRLHEDCATAVAHADAPLSSDTPERSGGEEL